MTKIEIPERSLFGLANLPYGVFSTPGVSPRVGVRVADRVVDLAATLGEDVFARPTLNAFMAQGRSRWEEVRSQVTALASEDLPDGAVHALDAVALHLPFEVADYVDFYASEYHASNLGRLFRPDAEPLMPNWKHLPVGYHGRA
ncbi:fumarylacetoacetase, partial [Spirillospora sp. NPDC000708]